MDYVDVWGNTTNRAHLFATNKAYSQFKSFGVSYLCERLLTSRTNAIKSSLIACRLLFVCVCVSVCLCAYLTIWQVHHPNYLLISCTSDGFLFVFLTVSLHSNPPLHFRLHFARLLQLHTEPIDKQTNLSHPSSKSITH